MERDPIDRLEHLIRAIRDVDDETASDPAPDESSPSVPEQPPSPYIGEHEPGDASPGDRPSIGDARDAHDSERGGPRRGTSRPRGPHRRDGRM